MAPNLFGRKLFYLCATTIFLLSLFICGAAGNLPINVDGMSQFIVALGAPL